MHAAITIPTYNRAHLIKRSVEASLAQTADNKLVVVVDDGSVDETQQICAQYFDRHDFLYIRLDQNMGTAAAKNVALALVPFQCVTFHDSDDIPHRDKLLRQVRTMQRTDNIADPCLPWHLNNPAQRAGEVVQLDLVLSAHQYISANGSSARISRTLSLVDDFFPGLQFGAGPLGDWVLINSGLFRRSALCKAGGFRDSVEEDRDLRNRLLMHGANVWFIDDPLLTKFEEADSLTAKADTGYFSERRLKDREILWQSVTDWQRSGDAPVVPIDLDNIEIGYISNRRHVALASDIAMTQITRTRIQEQLDALAGD